MIFSINIQILKISHMGNFIFFLEKIKNYIFGY